MDSTADRCRKKKLKLTFFLEQRFLVALPKYHGFDKGSDLPNSSISCMLST